MRYALAVVALLSLGGSALAAKPWSGHVDPSKLYKGEYPDLKLAIVDRWGVAEFRGRAEVQGKFIAEWTIDVDHDKPTLKTYWFWPSANALAMLPHWYADIANTIEVENGAQALVMFAGGKLANDFEEHRASKITVPGSIVITDLKVWGECGAAYARARAEDAKDIGDAIVDSLVVRVGCAGPIEWKAPDA